MIKLTQECTSTFSLNFGGENEIDLELLMCKTTSN